MSATTRAVKVREARTSSEGDIFGHLAGGEPPEGVEAPQAFQILAARAGGWQGTPTGFSSGNRCLARQSRTRLAVAAMRIAISIAVAIVHGHWLNCYSMRPLARLQ
jgi:hypothetical protein